jgi:quercetin dioxygenase-like cupin family protein
MAPPRVISQESVTPSQGAPGVSVARIVTEETGATQLSTGITTFNPGTSNTTHYHNSEESVIVIEGEGILVLNGEEHHLKQYDAAFVTPGDHHRFINNGDKPFKICWAYATVHVTRTLVEDG